MTGRVYYNDFEPFCVEWLKNLIAAGHLPAGDVDNRPIQEVTRNDVAGYTQCHFFAGIGGWPYALKLAGWPADRPVWTGSCPCQPFSAAGRGKGADDARHIWPDFFRLISECRPPILFGEQVASKDGRAWLGAVRADLETVGYAVGAADLCAAGVGAPHIRQRLWFVADAENTNRRSGERRTETGTGPNGERRLRLAGSSADGELGYASDSRLEGHSGDGDDRSESGRIGAQPCGSTTETSGLSLMADTDGGQSSDGGLQRSGEHGQQSEDRGAVSGDHEPRGESTAGAAGSECRQGAVGGHWNHADWLPCRDGKARPVEPGTFPLAHGIPQRVGRLRAYGNAIVPEAAETFIRSVIECRP